MAGRTDAGVVSYEIPPHKKDFKRSNSGSSCYKQRSYSNGGGDNVYGDLPMNFTSTRNNYEKMSRQDYEELEHKVDEYFNKKFFFQPPINNWSLPNPDVMFKDDKWQVDELQVLKKKLNNVKNLLNDYNLDDWHKHTRAMNKAGEIQWKLRKEHEPEFVTQAWCKFYENAMAFPLVPPVIVATKALNSVHLCEAPGAFITSLNHFLKLQYPYVQWKWLGTTLNPYYEGNPLSCMINDDRFILQTLSNWRFGEDMTGDLMNLKNMLHLVEEAKKMGDVLLVTADGSIDCQEDPGEQECIVSSLHFCETFSALHLLAKGGSFLLKMFTMYEHETVCLMYLLCCAFKAVNVFKPATSKEGNSEVYVVCLEYRGRDYMEPWLSKLREQFGPDVPLKAMFPSVSIPEDFIEQLYNCAKTFMNFQINVIKTNIEAYTRGKGRDFMTKKLRYMISNNFMEVYEMNSLEEDQEVVGKRKLKGTQTLNLDPRTEEGSFNDRRKRKTLLPMEQLKYIDDDLFNMKISWPFKEPIKWLKFSSEVSGFKIQCGKPVKTVQSSKFCLGRLLKMRNQVREIAKEISAPTSPISKHNTNEDVSSTTIDYNNPLIKIVMEVEPKYVKNNDLKVLNFKETLWTSMESGHNEEAELNAFEKILDTVDVLWRGQNLFLQGYPMLTQFNVGIVYMLGHLFKKVGFIKPNRQDFAVIFVGYCSWNSKMLGFLRKVDDALANETVLSVLPISRLCGKSPDIEEEGHDDSRISEGGSGDDQLADCAAEFYTCVTEVNHLCVKEQIFDIIYNVKHK